MANRYNGVINPTTAWYSSNPASTLTQRLNTMPLGSYWGDLGNRDALKSGIRPGLGTPGARERIRLAREMGVQPNAADLANTGMLANPNAANQQGRYGLGDATNPNSGGKTSDLFETISIVKNKPMDDAVTKMMGTWNNSTNNMSQSFDDMVNFFKKDVAPNLKQGFDQTNRYLDLDAIRNRMTGFDTAQAGENRGTMADYANLNQGTMGQQNDIMKQMYGNLEQTRNAIMNLLPQGAQNAATSQVARYNLGRGLATANSGISKIASNAFLNYMLPNMYQLYNMGNTLSGQDLALRGQQQGMEANRYGFNTNLLNNIYGNQRNTEQYVNSLVPTVSNLRYTNAQNAMNAMALPYNLQNQIMGGQIGTLGALAQLIPYGRTEAVSYLPGVPEMRNPRYFEPNIPVGMDVFTPPGAALPTMNMLDDASGSSGVGYSEANGGIPYTPLARGNNPPGYMQGYRPNAYDSGIRGGGWAGESGLPIQMTESGQAIVPRNYLSEIVDRYGGIGQKTLPTMNQLATPTTSAVPQSAARGWVGRYGTLRNSLVQ